MPLLIVLLVSVLLTGCQTTPEDYRNRLSQSHVCCTSVHQLHSHPTALDEIYHFKIGSGSQIETLTIEGQKTFSKKIKLPLYEQPYSIKVMSSAGTSSAFVPRIATLDNDHKVIRVFDQEDFRFNRNGYSGSIFVNEEDKDETYLLIITDREPENMPKFTQVHIQTASLGNGSSINWATGDQTTQYKYSLGGTVSLHFQSYNRLNKD